MTTIKKWQIAAVIAGCAPAANAGTIVQSGSLPMAPTNWTQLIQIQKFDDQGGARVLDAVEWTITGDLSGAVEAESLDNAASLITLSLASRVELALGSVSLIAATPIATVSYQASAYDGVMDFAGSSGFTQRSLSAMATASAAAADLTPFINVGPLSVPLRLTASATGQSSGSGSGNLLTTLTTNASLSYSVVYRFTAVPTPGSTALLGVAGVVWMGRRRRKIASGE